MQNRDSKLADILLNEGEVMTNDDEARVIEQNKEIDFSYDNGMTPMPGEAVHFSAEDSYKNLNSESGMDRLVQEHALRKLEQEKKYSTMSRSEMIGVVLEMQMNDYREKFHHDMDGQTKRRVRKQIERNFDKGMYFRKSTLNG